MLEITDKLDIEGLDFHEVLSAYPDPVSLFPFRVAGRYLPQGYDMVAEMRAPRLAKNQQRPRTHEPLFKARNPASS